MIDPLNPSSDYTRISGGVAPFGSTFKLLHEMGGYRKGSMFILVEQEDCFDPTTLKLCGVGETYLLDNTGTGLIIHADDETIDPLFQYVAPETAPIVIAPPVYITDSQFSKFRTNIAEALSKIATLVPKVGPAGTDGVVGIDGEKGDRGEKGEQGLQGEQGDQGINGAQGERGSDGRDGEKGEKGEKGEGKQGIIGEKGDSGKDGKQGEQGIQGADGKQGVAGIRGEQGKIGAKGDNGPKGSIGDSGLLAAKFPLVYDAKSKTVSIDEERLDKILKRIIGGKVVSPTDMGWLASAGGGGGKVAIKLNGAAITPDVRVLDFTGAAVTMSKLGGKVTINISSSIGELLIVDGGSF